MAKSSVYKRSAPEGNPSPEGMEDQKTIQQIANDIAPTQVSARKNELENRIIEIFVRKKATKTRQSTNTRINFPR